MSMQQAGGRDLPEDPPRPPGQGAHEAGAAGAAGQGPPREPPVPGGLWPALLLALVIVAGAAGTAAGWSMDQVARGLAGTGAAALLLAVWRRAALARAQHGVRRAPGAGAARAPGGGGSQGGPPPAALSPPAGLRRGPEAWWSGVSPPDAVRRPGKPGRVMIRMGGTAALLLALVLAPAAVRWSAVRGAAPGGALLPVGFEVHLTLAEHLRLGAPVPERWPPAAVAATPGPVAGLDAAALAQAPRGVALLLAVAGSLTGRTALELFWPLTLVVWGVALAAQGAYFQHVAGLRGRWLALALLIAALNPVAWWCLAAGALELLVLLACGPALAVALASGPPRWRRAGWRRRAGGLRLASAALLGAAAVLTLGIPGRAPAPPVLAATGVHVAAAPDLLTALLPGLAPAAAALVPALPFAVLGLLALAGAAGRPAWPARISAGAPPALVGLGALAGWRWPLWPQDIDTQTHGWLVLGLSAFVLIGAAVRAIAPAAAAGGAGRPAGRGRAAGRTLRWCGVALGVALPVALLDLALAQAPPADLGATAVPLDPAWLRGLARAAPPGARVVVLPAFLDQPALAGSRRAVAVLVAQALADRTLLAPEGPAAAAAPAAQAAPPVAQAGRAGGAAASQAADARYWLGPAPEAAARAGAAGTVVWQTPLGALVRQPWRAWTLPQAWLAQTQRITRTTPFVLETGDAGVRLRTLQHGDVRLGPGDELAQLVLTVYSPRDQQLLVEAHATRWALPLQAGISRVVTPAIIRPAGTTIRVQVYAEEIAFLLGVEGRTLAEPPGGPPAPGERTFLAEPPALFLAAAAGRAGAAAYLTLDFQSTVLDAQWDVTLELTPAAAFSGRLEPARPVARWQVPLAQQGYQVVAIELAPDGTVQASTNGLPFVPWRAWEGRAAGAYELWTVLWQRGIPAGRILTGRLTLLPGQEALAVEPVNGYLLLQRA